MLNAEMLEKYRQADTIHFMARRFNFLKYRLIVIDHQEIYLTELFPALGITPQQLATIFADGLTDATTYEGLGSMQGHDAFSLLATLLQKRLEVHVVDGMYEQLEWFTVEPLSAIDAAEATTRWTEDVNRHKDIRLGKSTGLQRRVPWYKRIWQGISLSGQR